MERVKAQVDGFRVAKYMKTLRSAGRYDEEIYQLVEDDLNFGLSEAEIELYLKKSFKLAQMKVLSGSLRRGMNDEFINLLSGHSDLSGYQMQVALEFYEKGIPIETIAASLDNGDSPPAMKELFQSILAKTGELTSAVDTMPEYVKGMIEQMEEVVKKISYQDERYDELNKKLSIFETTKRDEEIRDNLVDKLANTEADLSSQQDKIMQANSTIARLREQIADKEKEMKRMQTRIDTLEDKLLEKAENQVSSRLNVITEPTDVSDNVEKGQMEDTPVEAKPPVVNGMPYADPFTAGQVGIPVYYQMPVIDSSGRIVQRVQVERTARKSDSGLGAILGRLGFKKKSRQDIVKLVASGDLVPEQLIQIKSGIEKGLTEGQLVELINNNVSAEKMKEIIEIAVLENGMDY